MTCSPCTDEINKWLDWRPAPGSFGISIISIGRQAGKRFGSQIIEVQQAQIARIREHCASKHSQS